MISNNSLQGYSEAGIGRIGQNVTCTITGNALKGDGPVAGYFQAGIVLRAEAAGVIAGNTLTDHFRESGLGMPNWSAAIFLVYADPGTIHHLKTVNTFANNQVDVQYLGSAAAWD